MTPTTLLLTRPRHSAQAFAARLSVEARTAVDVLIAPLMEIAALDVVPDLSRMGCAVFTSANGVRHAPLGKGRDAFCVGARTTHAAKEQGWRARQLGETAHELIEALKTTPPSGQILHLGGCHTRGDIAENLTGAGLEARHIALYQQKLLELPPAARAALNNRCIVPVFSPRTAETLAHQAHGLLGNAHIIALSEAVAEPLRGENAAQLFILPTPDAVYMCKVVENLCFNGSLS
ncbi:MAG: uroporphyrinogen-III synthase [Sulfitobacter sp.]